MKESNELSWSLITPKLFYSMFIYLCNVGRYFQLTYIIQWQLFFQKGLSFYTRANIILLR